jgi:hypothetical protein
MAAYTEISCTTCGRRAQAENANSGVYLPSGWYEKKSKYFCCKQHRNDFFEASAPPKKEEPQSSTSNTPPPPQPAPEPKAHAEKKSGGLFGGLTNEMFSAIISSGDAEENQMREAIDYITKMTFSSDSGELSNQLNEIVSTGASSDKFKNGKTLKRTCYEKMEFGIMKLRQAGASAEADFFEKKRKSIKPGWF